MAKKRTKTATTRARATDASDPLGADDHGDTTVHAPIQNAPNPPPQPVMHAAKQIPGSTGSVPNTEGAPPSHIDPKTSIRVQASDIGYYDDIIRRVGDVFDIRNEKEFSKKWMVRVPATTPPRLTGSNEALERARKTGDPEVATGDDDVLGAQR